MYSSRRARATSSFWPRLARCSGRDRLRWRFSTPPSPAASWPCWSRRCATGCVSRSKERPHWLSVGEAMPRRLRSRRPTTDSLTPPPSPLARSSQRSGCDVRRSVRNERGFAILETAVTLPLLMLASVGVLEFGRAYQTSRVLTNAARQGALAAVRPNPAVGVVDAEVRQQLRTGGLISDGTVGVSVNG